MSSLKKSFLHPAVNADTPGHRLDSIHSSEPAVGAELGRARGFIAQLQDEVRRLKAELARTERELIRRELLLRYLVLREREQDPELVVDQGNLK
jgi:hypothetical protein